MVNSDEGVVLLELNQQDDRDPDAMRGLTLNPAGLRDRTEQNVFGLTIKVIDDFKNSFHFFLLPEKGISAKIFQFSR
ncbi:MAG: hypothetical protein V1807_01055 [Patescibacteria group bacterium]